jgi:hypothetical protein
VQKEWDAVLALKELSLLGKAWLTFFQSELKARLHSLKQWLVRNS